MTKRHKKAPADVIAERFVKMLEAGTSPWQATWWRCGSVNNPFTSTQYSGINYFMLSAYMMIEEWDDPRFATFNQIKNANLDVSHVIAGSQSIPVMHFRFMKTEDKKTGEEKHIPIMKYYNVFNIKGQSVGVDLPDIGMPDNEFTPVERAEQILAAYPGRPKVEHGGDRASYSETFDKIKMPKMDRFDTVENYYGVRFHEETHSTGHHKRMGRDLTGIAPSPAYAREELVAEMGSTLLCNEAGIEPNWDNSAAYFQSWLKALKNDKRLLFVAVRDAQKAANHILGITEKEDGELK